MTELLRFRHNEVSWISLVFAIAIFLYSSIIPNTPFISDESVYAYASYAIARGVVPYREIYLAHPPLMFYIYAFFIKLFGANIYYLRLITSAIYLFTGLLAYLVIKGILRDHTGGVCKLGLICMCLYVFLPMQIPFFTTIIIEPVFTLFTLASLVLYIMHYSHLRSRIFLFLAGIFMGLAVMTKLTAILFIVSMLIYHAVTYLREGKKLFNTLFIFLGIAIPCFFVLIWVSVWCHALEQFYLDLFYWPMVRIPTTLAEKLGNLTWYVEAFLPLLLTGALGAVFSTWKAKNERNSLFMLPVWLYGSNATLLIFLTPSYFHYFLHLTPYIAFLSIMFFSESYSILKEARFILSQKTRSILNRRTNFAFASAFCFIILLTLLLTSSLSLKYISSFETFTENPTTTIERYAGKYIMSITEPGDRIWTSEGSIAFFSQRLIVPPNSSNWPLQAFFSDALAHRWWTYAGDEMKDYKLGLATPRQFIEAWDKEDIKVIVIIRGTIGKAWIPYPDEILWNGYCGLEGVANYVQEHYELSKVITSSEVNYYYEIWVRKNETV